MTLSQATMPVTGNLIGFAVFLLPPNPARVGSIAVAGREVATDALISVPLYPFAILSRESAASPRREGELQVATDAVAKGLSRESRHPAQGAWT